jgi:hypothetical protein
MKIVKSMLFEKPGEQNTHECIRAVQDYMHDPGITHVVVASTRAGPPYPSAKH